MANIVITNTMSKKQNTVTLHTAGKYATDDIEVQNNVSSGTLANAATSGQTYVEDTSASTIIPSEGALYINKGWYDNTMITLSHIIPDPESGKYNSGAAEMRSGYVAYDGLGKKIVGTMTDVTPYAEGGTLSDPTSTSITVGGGTINVTPAITGSIVTGASATTSSTYGVTAQTPATGKVDGTDYLTLDPNATGGTATNSASITVTRSLIDVKSNTGYTNGTCTDIQSESKTYSGSASTSTSIQAGTNFYMPIVGTTLAGGAVTTSYAASSKTNPSITLTTTPGVVNGVSGDTIATYGLTATQPSSSTKYLKVVPGKTINQNGSVTITPKYTKTATTYTNTAGAIAAHNGTTGIDAVTTATASGGSATESFTLGTTETNFKSYYIPIVAATFSGGTVTTKAGGSVTTAGSITYSASTTQASGVSPSTYGITAGDKGTTAGYITIKSSASMSKAIVTATADAISTDVTYTNDAGAIAAHNGAKAIEGGNAAQTTKTVDISITPSAGTISSYYIPITTLAASGGALSSNTDTNITISGTGNISVTPSVAIKKGTTEAASTYGFSTTAPSGEYVTIDPGASAGDAKTITASITVGRGAVSVSGNAGATNGTGTGLSATSTTYTQSGTNTVGTSIGAGTNYYAPIVATACTITSHTTSNAVVKPNVTITGSTGVTTTGFSTTAPASGKYVQFVPGSAETTSGSATASVKAEISAGVTAGGSDTKSDTKSVGVTVTAQSTYYVEAYTGSYTIS